jgi:arabinogalactan endo-1,4-beta-galactosidase
MAAGCARAHPLKVFPQLRGVSLHPEATDSDPTVLRREFDMLHKAGANSVRFDIFWNSVEFQGRGVDDAATLARLDNVFAGARADHLKVILDLWSTPCWASSAPFLLLQNCSVGWWNRGVTRYPPRNPADYATFAVFAVRRWRVSLAALEIWNEPNSGQFLKGPAPAAEYAQLVEATYPVVKAVAPTLPVIASLGGTDTVFLGRLYSDGIRGNYDGIAVHPYDQPDLSGLRAFHAYQLSQGDSTPLWVTEVGWSSIVHGEAGQADDVASVLKQLAALQYVKAAEIYDMRDDGTDPTNPQDHFGLLYNDLAPKPAWRAFTRTLRKLAPPKRHHARHRRRVRH